MQSGHEHRVELCDYVSCEAHVPNDHPLRLVRAVADEAFEVFSPQFEGCYPGPGRASIALEKLLRSLLLEVFYTISSVRQLVEQLDYNLLFRWFAGLPIDSPRWDVAVFSKDCERLLAGDAAARFLAAVLGQPRVKALLSDEHFSPDGELIEAWGMPNGLQSRQRSTSPELEHNTGCDTYGENGEKLPYYPARRYASL